MKTKNAILVVTILLFSITSMSQSITNSDFENWINDTLYEKPDSFQTSNMMAYMFSSAENVTKSTDSYNGIYSARLETFIYGTDTVPGMLLLGSGEGFTGIPYTDKPDTLTAAIKYNIQANDTAIIMAMFTSGGNLIGMAGKTFTGSQSSWSLEKIPITFFLPAIPDSVILLVCSSNINGDQISGSWLQVDSLQFTGNSATPIANGNFENWTPLVIEEPYNWWNINFALTDNTPYSATKTTDAYHGTYALRLETREVFEDTLGFITNGRFDENGPTGGMQVWQTPDKLTGYYKYTPVGPDSALAALSIYSNSTIIDSSMIMLGAASTYTYFEISLNYNAWPPPDTLNIAFSSSNMENHANARVGSVLFLDSLNLTYKPVSINEAVESKNEFIVYPNPASNFINIMSKYPVKENVHISIYNTIGSIVLEKTLHSLSNYKLDISNLKTALYLYSIQTEDDVINGKFLKK